MMKLKGSNLRATFARTRYLYSRPRHLAEAILGIQNVLQEDVSKGKAMNEVVTTVPKWISYRLRSRKSVVDSSQRLAESARLGIHEVRRIALDSTATIDLRTDAITLLAASDEGNEGVLCLLLESGDTLIVGETLKRIREFGTDWALSVIISKIRASRNPSERAVLAWALAGYPGSGDGLDVLLGLIERDPEVNVRDHAIESLSEFRSPVVISTLLKVLEHGSASERFWSLYSLGTIRDPRAIEAIAQCLHDETLIPEFGTISDEAQCALEEIAEAGP